MYRPGDTRSYVVTDHENYDVEYVERGLITNHIGDPAASGRDYKLSPTDSLSENGFGFPGRIRKLSVFC